MKLPENTVRYYNKNSGTTYVYEILEHHWDPDRKQTVSKRRLIGKIDPSTGEVVPTGSAGRPRGSRNRKKSSDTVTSVSTVQESPSSTSAAASAQVSATSGISTREMAGLQKAVKEYLLNEQKIIQDCIDSLEEYSRRSAANTDALLKQLAGTGLRDSDQSEP